MSEKFGFIYVWYDRKHKRFYVGSHWGTEDDGYICSSRWMRKAYRRRPEDFKRRVVKRIYSSRIDLLNEETRWLCMMQEHELAPRNTTDDARLANVRYYNFNRRADHLWHAHDEPRKTVGQKISAAKKGKTTGPCSPEKAAKISEAKKRKFAERKALTGSTGMPSTRGRTTGWKQTPEWKAAQAERVRQQWNDGTRSKEAMATWMRENNPQAK